MGQRNLFNKITKLAKHLKYNSSLQKFNDVIDWKIFHEDLDPMYIPNSKSYFLILHKEIIFFLF